MSAYENVVTGKLRLKGRPLDVRGGCIKKKVKHKNGFDKLDQKHAHVTGQMTLSTREYAGQTLREDGEDNHLTEAERRYLEQWQKMERQRLAKTATKSHRDRIQEFNQYLANLTEHYDIPKVGPG